MASHFKSRSLIHLQLCHFRVGKVQHENHGLRSCFFRIYLLHQRVPRQVSVDTLLKARPVIHKSQSGVAILCHPALPEDSDLAGCEEKCHVPRQNGGHTNEGQHIKSNNAGPQSRVDLLLHVVIFFFFFFGMQASLFQPPKNYCSNRHPTPPVASTYSECGNQTFAACMSPYLFLSLVSLVMTIRRTSSVSYSPPHQRKISLAIDTHDSIY